MTDAFQNGQNGFKEELPSTFINPTLLPGSEDGAPGLDRHNSLTENGSDKKKRKREEKAESQSRKESHKIIEQKRRQKINEKISELRDLLNYPDGSQNKAVVLQAAVDNIRCLKMACNKLLLNHRQLQNEYLVILGENDQLRKVHAVPTQPISPAQALLSQSMYTPPGSLRHPYPVDNPLGRPAATAPLSSLPIPPQPQQQPNYDALRQQLRFRSYDSLITGDQMLNTLTPRHFSPGLTLTSNDMSLLYDEVMMSQLVDQGEQFAKVNPPPVPKGLDTYSELEVLNRLGLDAKFPSPLASTLGGISTSSIASSTVSSSTQDPGPRYYSAEAVQQLLGVTGMSFDTIVAGMGLGTPQTGSTMSSLLGSTMSSLPGSILPTTRWPAFAEPQQPYDAQSIFPFSTY